MPSRLWPISQQGVRFALGGTKHPGAPRTVRTRASREESAIDRVVSSRGTVKQGPLPESKMQTSDFYEILTSWLIGGPRVREVSYWSLLARWRVRDCELNTASITRQQYSRHIATLADTYDGTVTTLQGTSPHDFLIKSPRPLARQDLRTIPQCSPSLHLA